MSKSSNGKNNGGAFEQPKKLPFLRKAA